jgi:hypothetical protein
MYVMLLAMVVRASRTAESTLAASRARIGVTQSPPGADANRCRVLPHAKATFRKDRRLNIRLSSKDLEAIQKRALAEGLPYQTLLHKYAAGRRKEI